MKMKKQAASMLLAIMLLVTGFFAVGRPAEADASFTKAPITIDLISSKSVKAPAAVINLLAALSNTPLISQNKYLDFNHDGNPDVSVQMYEDNVCLLTRMSGADKLKKNYIYTVDSNLYTEIRFQVCRPVTGVKLNRTSAKLSIGGKLRLTAKVLPENAGNKKVVWKSTNTKVATVTQQGYVVGRHTGTAVIRVITADGKKTATCKITVAKSTPKLKAKNYSFKKNVKIKKVTCTLKHANGKAIKGAKLTLKVNNKTYKATTNSKGKAVFKISKLTKKGTFTARITYAGSSKFNKASKKIKIRVK